MRKTAGQIIRLAGLLIEMFGIWRVMSETGEKGQASVELAHDIVISLPWIAVGLGFVVWLTGTILAYTARPRRKSLPKDERELAL
jgi:hypothetical protein